MAITVSPLLEVTNRLDLPGTPPGDCSRPSHWREKAVEGDTVSRARPREIELKRPRRGKPEMGIESMEVCRVFTAIAMAASVTFVGGAMAQAQAPAPGEQRPPGAGQETPTQAEEKKVEGQVRSVDPSGTEITLTDGTKLTTPPRTALKPGVLAEGAIVVASYREENGKKVLTGLALKEPSASPNR